MNREYVIFKLDGEYYGLNIAHVENIERNVNITRVPNSKSYVKGIINLRGNVIPVIDLRLRFNLDSRAYDDETRVIIVNYDTYKIGIIVDSSSETLEFQESEIEVAPAVKNLDEDYVKELGKHNNRIIMLLDLRKTLNIAEE